MSFSQDIARHLPLLRRYARALTGSQRRGDDLVAATLQALIDSPEAQASTLPARVGLYRALTAHAVGMTAAASSEEIGAVADAQTRLSVLAPAGRQALLLTTLEGFTDPEAAQILGLDSASLQRSVADARAEIALQSRGRVLIIEDEALIAMDLSDIVTSLGHIVVATASTAAKAVEHAAKHLPNLILADIQLADGSSGITAVHDILASVSKPVIFITAFPERLLTGERPEPTFLIAKPYAEETVRTMISQALFFGSTPAGGHAATAAHATAAPV
jgi:DNA-directed RNA polymerase specialized sigma24 family protein/CheY-like chemotaxis protein